ncbi:hypothetical protein GCM10011399_17260 [Subtercola lobariae]|uniref:Uncharacterized protein n=1 Tax=Subtercola lobariae TaxID=1588641 RepID=A0A917B5Y7_9MICO|nr:hypothetical protein GCM10011399_17260 [Subtercola lobariae]
MRRSVLCGTDLSGCPGWVLPTALLCGARTFLGDHHTRTHETCGCPGQRDRLADPFATPVYPPRATPRACSGVRSELSRYVDVLRVCALSSDRSAAGVRIRGGGVRKSLGTGIRLPDGCGIAVWPSSHRRYNPAPSFAAWEFLVLDIAYLVGVVVLFGLVALIARGVAKL